MMIIIEVLIMLISGGWVLIVREMCLLISGRKRVEMFLKKTDNFLWWFQNGVLYANICKFQKKLL